MLRLLVHMTPTSQQFQRNLHVIHQMDTTGTLQRSTDQPRLRRAWLTLQSTYPCVTTLGTRGPPRSKTHLWRNQNCWTKVQAYILIHFAPWDRQADDLVSNRKLNQHIYYIQYTKGYLYNVLTNFISMNALDVNRKTIEFDHRPWLGPMPSQYSSATSHMIYRRLSTSKITACKF